MKVFPKMIWHSCACLRGYINVKHSGNEDWNEKCRINTENGLWKGIMRKAIISILHYLRFVQLKTVRFHFCLRKS